MTEQKKKSVVEETMNEVLVDPASPTNHPSKKPPQTIGAEPHQDKR